MKTTLVVLGAIIFNIIFWNEKLGINTVIFDVFIIGSIFYLYPVALKNTSCRWIAVGNLVALAMLIVHNTILSKLAVSCTLLLLVGFSQYLHRSVWYASGSIFLNYLLAVPNFFQHLRSSKLKDKSRTGLFRRFRIIIIPLGILFVFIIIYSMANSVFSQIMGNMIQAVENWFGNFFDWSAIERFIFLLFGTFLTAGLILKTKYNYFSELDIKQRNDLMRDKNALKRLSQSSLADLFSVLMGRRATGILALKNEYLVGFISLVLLNILLLFINIIDLKYVWLGFTSSADVNLAEYVHEGTGLLIFSIVLAMLLLLFFFRGNLNFYRKNKWLKYGAYLWIFQNLFLVISVLMRDYYYISHYGLAYKRIGLLFFLLMVLVGLVTVFLKILEIKTSYYLLRVNAWAGIFLLITASTIHWDETIARYNLDRKDTIPLDVAFLLSLSDKTLPILIENKDVLEKTTVSYFNYNEHGYSGSAMNFLDYRINEFLEKQKEYSWLSWNMADEVVKRNLEVSKNIVAAK